MTSVVDSGHFRGQRVFGVIAEANQLRRLVTQGQDRLDMCAVVPLRLLALLRGARDPGAVEHLAQLAVVGVPHDRVVGRVVERQQHALAVALARLGGGAFDDLRRQSRQLSLRLQCAGSRHRTRPECCARTRPGSPQARCMISLNRALSASGRSTPARRKSRKACSTTLRFAAASRRRSVPADRGIRPLQSGSSVIIRCRTRSVRAARRCRHRAIPASRARPAGD